MTINNVARKWDLQQQRITNIAINQDRKDSDSPSQDPCQIDGSTTSGFPEETGYVMVFSPDTSLWRTELEVEIGSHLSYNYLKIVFLRTPTEIRNMFES